MPKLSGIFAPIAIPFHADESIAYDKLALNLQKWGQGPLDGIVVPGSNSEATSLAHAERLEIWKACAAGLQGSGKTLIAGTGVETTRETIQLTQAAAQLGMQAALVLPPFFYKPQMTHEVLLAHYRAVADASPIPLMVYNVPAFTGVDFAPATLLALAEHPRIVGVKDSSSNVLKVASLLARRPDFIVFAGTGSALLPMLSLGAAGGIAALANFAGGAMRAVMDDFQQGRLSEARTRQLALADINTAVTSKYGVPGLKYAMELCGFYGGPTRRPLLPLPAEARAEIERLVREMG